MKKLYPLAALGGVRPELGAISSRDRMRYGSLGSLLLVTGAVGGLGVWILAQMLFGLDWAFALIPAALWIICVITIDRALTMTFPDTLSRRVAVPVAGRLAIALVIGLIVSTPITLQLFKGEIDVKIATLQGDLREELNAQNSADPQVARIPALKKSIADANAIIDAGLTAARLDPTYVAADAAASAAQANFEAKRDARDNEAGGTGGSGIAGVGDIVSKLDEGVADADEIYQERKADAASALTAATDAATTAIDTATNDLPDLQEELRSAEEREAVLTSENEARVDAAGGLHNRLNGLFELAGESSSGFFIHLAWFLFFLFIEMMPVIYKLTMVGRAPTEEAKGLALEDEEIVVRARERLKRYTADAEAETEIAVARADARRVVGLDGAERDSLRGVWQNELLDEAQREAVVNQAEWVRSHEPWREQAASSTQVKDSPRFDAASPEEPLDESSPRFALYVDDVDDQAWVPDQPQKPSATPAPADDPFRKNPIVGDRFRLVELYQSGDTEVWKAVDLSDETGAIVAVKLLPETRPDDYDAEQRHSVVAKEVKLVQSLPVHDNVMKVLTAGVTDDTRRWWYASPWYGPSLHAHLAAQYQAGRVDAMPQLITVVEYVRDAALGLAAAHGKGISHGDIKPGNLVLDEISRRVRVIDFGLARTVETLSRQRSQTPKGTIYYSAPELSLRGDGGQSPFLSDVFSLGGVLYFLLTGRRPRFSKDVHIGAGVEDVAYDIDEGRLTLAPLSAQLPSELVALTVRALTPNPADRFGYWVPELAAKEFADALDEMMEHWGSEVRHLRVGPQLLTDGPANWETSFYRPKPEGNDDTESASSATHRAKPEHSEPEYPDPERLESAGPETARPAGARPLPQLTSASSATFDPFDELTFPITTHIRPTGPAPQVDLETPTETMGDDLSASPPSVEDTPTERMQAIDPSSR